MTALSQDELEKARKYHSLILQQLALVGQRPVAEALGISVTTVSKAKDSRLKGLCRALEALELKVVPEGHVEVCPEHLESVEALADIGLKYMRGKL